ncbi:DNA topoisomerase IB [Mitsuaria sp. GD03876]|uniref:DNA topoisomerase IB n=1 Tax=Mitsuaria sp. GD03876 TaxID=2975399 RepID=UPI00244ABF87|nr:DNA topoisomerase IB [Mitsuaria sp. GD03876]MDH0866079.1 DNA topoisomerase IB [Mitsuaria sp. GD03876]
MSLRWVSDCEPGLRRRRAAKGFRYVDADGRPVKDAATLRRIRALAIPPAYVDVWICARDDGHIQATARDARGRKQYRYHADWMALRGENKFGLLLDFGQRLPRLRRQVARRLREGGLDRERVIAALVRLLDRTWMRIGHREYARSNGSYGLSTLLSRHVKVQGDALLLSFPGKSGVRHQLAVRDDRVAALVRRCRDLPGQELFGYEDEAGEPHRIDASDVNDWLASAGGPTCSAKVFRTWHASVLALDLLLGHARAGTAPVDALKRTVADVATRLGNTVAVCRKSYIHPAVLAWGQSDRLAELPSQRWMRAPPAGQGLSIAERRLMGLLKTQPRVEVATPAPAPSTTGPATGRSRRRSSPADRPSTRPGRPARSPRAAPRPSSRPRAAGDRSATASR